MVDRVPAVLLFPKYRKHSSVKFPSDLPITLPNLLHFLLRHAGSEQHAGPGAPAPGAVFLALQREVQALRGARELLAQQLAQMWRDDRRLTFDALGAEAGRERRRAEERHREAGRRLGEAEARLRALADGAENTPLGVLLRALRDTTEAPEEPREEAQPKRSHMAS
ncbi:Thioredoxin domain-containing protein 11 [Liparis tanakae]|uniref:Thioredoxin domain-containing protein 11 n=1 Tax=Liparis tanakae TaxID=230148 RepID=A0A4Z2EHJ7_9TELE|nr:Thioredoxin domain-containing protein 11 [Liparis tanakae]